MSRRLKPKRFAPVLPFVAKIIGDDDTTTHRLIEASDEQSAFNHIVDSMEWPSWEDIRIQPLPRQTTFQHPFQLMEL